MRQFGGIQHIPRLSDLSTVTYEYGLVDIDIAMIRHASRFWEMRMSSIDFPLYSRDGQEWFFVRDLSSLVSNNLPLLADILRDYTLEFKIRVESALVDRDYYRELADTLMKDIKEMSNVQERELAALKAELDQMGPAPLGTEVECA